jgi:hypothetical protein
VNQLHPRFGWIGNHIEKGITATDFFGMVLPLENFVASRQSAFRIFKAATSCL